MFQKRYALLAEADDGDGAGAGAAGGGSSEGDPGKLKDGDEKAKFESRIRAALSEQERKLRSEFESRLAEASNKREPDPPKKFTRADLTAAIEAGQITQAQADQQWEAQFYRDAEERAHRVALETVSAAERTKLVNSEIARYKAVAPEILDDSHETRGRIREAYSALLELGDDPRDVATQLKAIRQVLGPVDRVERARSGRFKAEHHQDSGAGGGGPEAGGDRKTGKKLVDQLNTDSKRAYQRKIDSGIYANWDAVEAELKYAKPATRARLGIAA